MTSLRNKGIALIKGCNKWGMSIANVSPSNVRVSPYDFEDIDIYITRYGLEDVLCFASDYRHVEGGGDPVGAWYKRLEPLGQGVVEKFFVTNGKWWLPD
jgi:hypothetical protein